LRRGPASRLLPFERDFTELLARHEAVLFGDFTLKSGRRSPYFVNAGQLRTGEGIAGLGRAYAERIRAAGLACDLVFGPAYKGIPLAVATSIALAAHGRDVPYAFDRKEPKDHGEGGVFVGTQPGPGMSVVVVDDVITSGSSIRGAVELLRTAADARVSGVVVAVDRLERGRTGKPALAELREELGVDILPIVTIEQVVEHLATHEVDGRRLVEPAQREAVLRYLAEHAGAR
jgi:orotate phosphoribosyltransferase